MAGRDDRTGPVDPLDVLRERLQFVLESAAMGFWDFDIVADQTTRSLRHDECFGYDVMQPHWSYETFLEHVHPADRELVDSSFTRAMAGHGDYDVEFRVVWPDGQERWLVVRGRFVHDEQGQPLRVGGVVGDVTVHKAAQHDALENAVRLARLVESMGDAVVTQTLDGVILSWNPSAEGMFGWSSQEAVGRHASELVPAVRAQEAAQRMAEVATGATLRSLPSRRVRRDGTAVDVEITLSPLHGSAGAVIGSTAVVRDVTRQRQLEQDLQRQALHDALTGLPNRALLADRLGHALARAERTGRPVAVLVLDLDGFKVVNDAAGHAVGDLLLVEASARLVASVRPGDTVARSGGDEFVLLCEDTDAAGALEVADRVHAAFARPMELEGHRLYVTGSIGVALSPPLEAETLLRSADVAMYDAKSTGRARTSLFRSPMAQRAIDRMELSHDLRQAIDDDALELRYQPVVDLRTGRLLGVEALARWTHPQRGDVPPAVFVEVAEATGQITALDRWVLHRACRDGADMVARGLLGDTGYVAVNVGARDVAEAMIGAMVIEAVQSAGAGLDYERLVIEVTETGALGDPDISQKALRELRDLGVTVALDDFGTGYSSLSHLQRLPISILKLDLTFVGTVDADPANETIVRSLVQLAAAMGMGAVAEGVERAEQVTVLRQLGCAAGQGWLWAPALAPAALVELLQGLPDGCFDVG